MEYKIKKNHHYSHVEPVLLMPSLFGNYLVTIEFDHVPGHQEFYSKLIGFGRINPRNRSERIGWRFCSTDSGIMAEVCNYTEKNKRFKFIEPLKIRILNNVETGKPFVSFMLSIARDKFSVGNYLEKSGRLYYLPLDIKESAHYLCCPYFGGDDPADQDYKITFDKVNSTFINYKI